MVQRKLPSKLSIKPHLLKSDTQLQNLRPPSPKTHDLKKIMKKPRPITRSEELRPLPPPTLRKKRTQMVPVSSPQKQSPSPNYMKSTTSFDARKERSTTTTTPKGATASSEKMKPSRKVVRTLTLTKTPSFKPSRPVKKCSPVILSARRTTCSSTLKDSKFPSYLELSHGGTELEGTSAFKVCPYSYCSLNGHHHAPVPPLRCFLSARRRALKTQKSFKLGCLSPRQTKPVKQNDEVVREQVIFADGAPEVPVMEEESRDFFVEIYSKDREDLECSAMDWEEGYCYSSSSSCVDDEQTLKSPEMDDDDNGKTLNSPEIDDDGKGKTLKSPEIDDDDDDVCEEKIQKTGFEELYDEESVSSGAWNESDGDYESDSSYQAVEINHQNNMDEDTIDEVEAKTDELQSRNLEETSRESETSPDFAENSSDDSEKHHTTIIYNIIQYNISIFFNGKKTEQSEPDKIITVQVPATSGDLNQKIVDDQENTPTDQLDTNFLTEKQEDPEREYDENEGPNSMDFEDSATRSDEEPAISGEELSDSSMDLKNSTRGKKPDQETEDSREFNPRGPNFLPKTPDPDAETVDLRHQTMDERKNSEEWMVDFALQQAVTNLSAAERKKKVSLLVEAFEKVIPIPRYENSRTSKAFTNARPMQACS